MQNKINPSEYLYIKFKLILFMIEHANKFDSDIAHNETESI
jgi:hypothetical protein